MQSIRPRTYRELMQYKRCLELKHLVPEVDESLFARIYQHTLASGQNRVGVSEGKLVFYENDRMIDSIAVAMGSAITAIRLSSTALDVERPFSASSSSDSGSSGNNNNNNNNNNNG